ncbi:hypothetical protein D5301_12895 [Stenotrophomonas sp. MH181796]|uniref:hypothetical protein n=1 Tax=Stenotrophomonas sp. MH181796 TaxID=2339228 RepID=UPI00129C766F|nr:hypothetical protein [Stenotrophomonas sp. MH181796]MRI43131.1 hypothetical protein [Stenotrophomonas sp. MH181796]
MSEALIPLESVNAVEVFTGGGLDDLLARIRAEAVTLVPNVKTVAGRKEIASIAYKVSRSKTAIDDAGKALVADLKKQTGDIDSARKKARDTLDALRDEVRKPLTDWEAEQERIERERVEAEERARAAAEEARLAELARKEEEIRAREEAVRAAEEAERERVEREARLQAEAAENAKREAAAAVERAEREAREATERAAREAAEAEQRAKDAAERAEREKAEAVAAAERRAQEEAERAERERQAQADAQRKADEARAADVEHRRSINRAAMAALIAQGISEDDAATVITAIVQGKVPAVAIRY